jgi:hypothetical protein
MYKGAKVVVRYPEYWLVGYIQGWYESDIPGEKFKRFEVRIANGWYVDGAHPSCVVLFADDRNSYCRCCARHTPFTPREADKHRVVWMCTVCAHEVNYIEPLCN